MLKKIVLSLIGGALILFSGILAVYVGMQSSRGAMFRFENIVSCGVIIGGPIILGTILIILSVAKEKRRKIILLSELLLFLVYGIIVFVLVFGGFRIWAIGYKGDQSLIEYIRYNSNLVPFKTIGSYVRYFFSGRINRSSVIDNLLGNLMMFMPIGFFLPAIFKKQRKWLCFLITIVLILMGVEIIQLVFRLGVLDIDDFILNAAGACLAYAIIRIGIIKRFLNKTMLI